MRVERCEARGEAPRLAPCVPCVDRSEVEREGLAIALERPAARARRLGAIRGRVGIPIGGAVGERDDGGVSAGAASARTW